MLGCLAAAAAAADVDTGNNEPQPPAPPTSLRVDREQHHDLRFEAAEAGHFQLRTTGNDPWIIAHLPPAAADATGARVLTFEYRSPQGVIDLEIFHGPPWTGDAKLNPGNLPAAAEWQRVHILLGDPARDRWVEGVEALRIDFGERSGVDIDVRQLELRPPTVAERDDIERERRIWWQKEAEARSIVEYLDFHFPDRIERVTLDDERVRIRGRAPGALRTEGADGWLLLERLPHEPSWQLSLDTGAARQLHEVAPDPEDEGRFEVELPRFAAGGRDRLGSRWQLLRSTADGLAAMSHNRHADEFPSLPQDPASAAAEPDTIKGITCAENLAALDEFGALGLGHATFNLLVNRVMQDRDPRPLDSGADNPSGADDPDSDANDGVRWFEYGGQLWPIDRAYAIQLDRVVAELHSRGVRISAVLLLSDPRAPGSRHRLIHPEAAQAGIYAMPNLTTAETALQYEAALAYLTQRFRPAPESPGPVVNWIVHNEIDHAWTWCNMGEQPTARLLDVYQRSLRMTDLLARRANPDARAMISITHHWTAPGDDLGRSHRTADLLRYLRRFDDLEGGFPWGVAHHPYPVNLFNPVTWHDPVTPHRLDAHRITLRNIEVLHHWLQLPEVRHHGEPRRLILSEQGFHTPDESGESLATQAAALVYAWHKLEPLELVEAFHYHRLTDHPAEGGLRLGLRGFATDNDLLGPRKPGWHIYRALGTAAQEAAAAPYLERLPYPDPDQIPYRGPIDGPDPTAWDRLEDDDPDDTDAPEVNERQTS